MAKDSNAGFGFGSKGSGGSLRAVANPTGATGASNISDWGARGRPDSLAPAPVSGPVTLPETVAKPMVSRPSATSAPAVRSGDGVLSEDSVANEKE